MEYKAKQICVLPIVSSRQAVINTFGLSPARSGSAGVHVAQLKFSPQEIEQVRNIDLLHVVQGYGVELKKQGREYVGLCPFHADKSPSLRVHPENGWRCSPCDDDGHAIDFVMKCLGDPDPKKGFVVAMNQLLGKAPARFTPPPQRAPAPEEESDGWERLTDMAPASPPPKPWRQCHGKPFTDRHEFRDADGTLIGFVDRFKGDDGKVTIPWTCWINKETGEEEWRRKGFLDRRPLYGRDKLAKYPEARVLVVEGERTADKAQAHFIAAGILLDRLVVVSWHGGTGVVDQVDLAPLHGRNVCAWPDSDQKVYGKDHPQAGEVKPFIEQGGTIAMLDVYAAIREHCTDVKFVIPPGAPGRSTGLEVKDGWDLADEFPPGFNPRSYIQKGSERVVMASVIQGQRDAARATATPTPAQASNQKSGELTEPQDPSAREAMEADQDLQPKPVKGGEKAQAAVAELNSEHAVVLAGDKVVVLRECMSDNPDYEGMSEVRLLSRDAFRMLYENCSVWVEIVDKDGKEKGKLIPIADWWLKSPDRRQYVNGITFRPDGKAPLGYYNLWHGHAVEPLPLGIFRNAMKCRRLLRHMNYNVCRGNREHYRYLLAWMADLVQDPARKKGVALVLRGNKGSGKSKIAEVLASLFGLHAIKVSQTRHLVGNFNRHLAAKVLLVAEESFWAGGKADDGPLKDMITSKTVTLEAKGVDAFEMPSYLRIVMVTNNAWAVPATDDERRYFVLDVGDDHRQDLPYFAAIDEQIERNDGEGRRALLALLKSIDLSGVNLRKVPETAALRKQRALSMEVEDQFIHDALVDGELLGADWEMARSVPKVELYEAYVRYSKGRGKPFTLDSALFGKNFMKRTGAVGKRLRLSTERTQAYKVPARKWVAERFAQQMKIDLAEILDGTADDDDDSPF